MSRVLALDVGKRRTGVAVSDSLRVTTKPLPTIHHKDLKELFSEVLRIIKELNVAEVVVGIPERTDGRAENRMKTHIERFIEMLRRRRVLVREMPEWFTTKEAKALLNRSQRRNKEKIDAKAAQIILASYLRSMEK